MACFDGVFLNDSNDNYLNEFYWLNCEKIL